MGRRIISRKQVRSTKAEQKPWDGASFTILGAKTAPTPRILTYKGGQRGSSKAGD